MKSNKIHFVHAKQMVMFYVSKGGDFREHTTFIKKDHLRKVTKFDLLDYRLQFTKAYQFFSQMKKWRRTYQNFPLMRLMLIHLAKISRLIKQNITILMWIGVLIIYTCLES